MCWPRCGGVSVSALSLNFKCPIIVNVLLCCLDDVASVKCVMLMCCYVV